MIILAQECIARNHVFAAVISDRPTKQDGPLLSNRGHSVAESSFGAIPGKS